MDPSFTGSLVALRQRWKAFGLTLRPLTVGHLFLLLELENKYPDHPDQAKDSDLFTAILVCSQDPRSARRMLKSRFADFWIWLWGRHTRGMDWTKEAKAFGEYLRDNLQRPEPDEFCTATELRVPLAWRLKAMLMAEFGFTPEEALEREVTWALTLWAVESDRRGSSKVASERQLTFRAWVLEMEKQRLANEAAEAYAADEGKGEL